MEKKKSLVTITYTSLTTLINALASSASVAENIIDQAINLLNTCGASISNLTGVAGAKTGTYTQAEAGAILTLSAAVYSSTYLTSGGSSSSINIGALGNSQSSSSQGGSSSLFTLARDLANTMQTRTYVKV